MVCQTIKTGMVGIVKAIIIKDCSGMWEIRPINGNVGAQGFVLTVKVFVVH